MNCDYCKKTFSSKSNLLTHQKTAKYCVELQGLQPTYFECEYCNKKFTSQQNRIEHTCKDRDISQIEEKIKFQYAIKIQDLERQLQEKNEYITKLEARLDKFENVITNMASEPKTLTTTNNTNSNNTVYMTKFDINDTKQIGDVLQKHLTKDVIARGQEGIALMLGEHLLKGPNGEPLYECTDVARQKFEFINADGNVETDPKATKLIRSINNSGLCQQATVAANDLWTNEDGRMDTDKYGVYAGKVTEVMQLEKDSTKLRNKLASVTARQKHVGKK